MIAKLAGQLKTVNPVAVLVTLLTVALLAGEAAQGGADVVLVVRVLMHATGLVAAWFGHLWHAIVSTIGHLTGSEM